MIMPRPADPTIQRMTDTSHSPSDVAHLRGLVFTARRLVDGLYAGRHGSPRTGQGSDFHDYRAYCPGDDTSSVDWKLFGRTNRYYVRRHRHLSDLQVYLMVDCPASMDFAGLDGRGAPLQSPDTPTKLSYAKTLAAAIAYLTVRQGDRVGVGLFTDKLDHHLPPGGTPAHLERLCVALEQAPPGPGQGDVNHALRQAHRLTRRRGLYVLVSDLLDEPGPLFDGLGLLRHDGSEVIVLQVLTPTELDLPALGGQRLRLIDAETHRSVTADVPTARRQYAQAVSEHLAILRRGCASQGVDYNLATTDTPATRSLRRYLVRRASMNR
jgi:uncharacterized protein (DUF58 family)